MTTCITVMGTGLALRGPDGSMVRAVEGMYKQRAIVFRCQHGKFLRFERDLPLELDVWIRKYVRGCGFVAGSVFLKGMFKDSIPDIWRTCSQDWAKSSASRFLGSEPMISYDAIWGVP